MKKTIYLDLDGVCCDFMGSALKSLNKHELLQNWPAGTYSIEKAVGINNADFCDVMNGYTSDFWRNLEEYPWFWTLYKELGEFGDVVFCSKPATSPQSLKGKLEWLQDRFGKDFREYVFIDKKFYLANENAILVDDDIRQVSSFRDCGGKVILFPQLWNDNHFYIQDRLAYVRQRILTECL